MNDALDTRGSPEDRDLLIALNVAMRSGREALCRLAAAPSAWLETKPREVPSVAHELGIPAARLRQALRLLPTVPETAAGEMRRCLDRDCTIITRLDADYPAALFDLDLPPPVLYCRGTVAARPAIAVVGSRRSDPYGLEVAELFSRELARRGMSVVSGLALGIDTAAHRGALAGGGHTLAVLGCGIDIVYPRSNRRITDEISRAGALISEFPFGSPPAAWHFPIRNRLIAALSFGTLVIRATPRSGSLITARQAIDLGREVFAVPGSIFDPRSVGPNCLIRDGATPVQHPREIVDALPCGALGRLAPSASPPASPAALDERLSAVLRLLPVGVAVTQEEIISGSRLPAERTVAALLELELEGWVHRHPGARYVRSASPRDRIRPV